MKSLTFLRVFGAVGVYAALPLLLSGQNPLSVDTNSPEGRQISAIEHETDLAKKQSMLEEFTKSFSKEPIAAWASTQLQTMYLKGQQYDKVIAAGQDALSVAPDNLDAAYTNLKASEAKGDFAGIEKWAGETSKIAKKLQTGAAAGANSRADYAKQVDTYTEYSVYAASLKTTEPAEIISLVESLEQRNPQSPYLGQAYGRYLNALRQAGQPDKAAAAAERQLQRDPNSEDALLVAAGLSMQQKQDKETAAYSSKLVEVMQTKPKPEGMADADWEKKKTSALGLGYWMQGVSYSNLHQFAPGDKALRQALPLLKDNPEVLGMALFHLGLCDYQLAKTTKARGMLQDALKFSQQSAQIKSPLQTQAQTNVAAIKKQLGPAR